MVHRWRLEFIKNNLLIDWAHNKDWLIELKKYIDQNLKSKFDKIVYCFSLKKWKNTGLIINIFWKDKTYILVDIKSNMLLDTKDYKNKFLVKSKNYILKKSQKNKKFLYVIFWSLYMIWEFLR